jgi:hypothetical protein
MILPPKQTITIVQEAYGLVTKMEDIKYSKKYDRGLMRTEKIKKELIPPSIKIYVPFLVHMETITIP